MKSLPSDLKCASVREALRPSVGAIALHRVRRCARFKPSRDVDRHWARRSHRRSRLSNQHSWTLEDSYSGPCSEIEFVEARICGKQDLLRSK